MSERNGRPPRLTPGSESRLLSILRQYPFEVRKITPVQVEEEKGKGVWKVETESGTLCLKRTGQPAERIAFSVAAQRHLAAHGAPVPEVIPTRDGSYFVVEDGQSDRQVYAVYQWISGRSPRWEDREELRASVVALARLHAASRGFKVPQGVQIFTKLGRWPENYEETEARLKEWKEQAAKQPENGLNAHFLAGVDIALELAAHARHALAASPYAAMVQRLWPGETLIHQDFGPSNLVLTRSDPYLLDLDTVTFEFPARNLRKLACELMQSKGGWRNEVLDEILEWYTATNPLSQEHLQLLAIDLLFPHAFHDAAKNWFKKNKPEKPERIARAARLEKEKADALSVWLRKLG
ncbi:MAG: CotS family spore coat protein [Limnochordales bacterium]|nr:CotS family spore coat protein [Limnochordales bacterium]